MPSLADVLPRVEKVDRRDRHDMTWLPEVRLWACHVEGCWHETDDLTEVARHVVENQWQSK